MLFRPKSNPLQAKLVINLLNSLLHGKKCAQIGLWNRRVYDSKGLLRQNSDVGGLVVEAFDCRSRDLSLNSIVTGSDDGFLEKTLNLISFFSPKCKLMQRHCVEWGVKWTHNFKGHTCHGFKPVFWLSWPRLNYISLGKWAYNYKILSDCRCDMPDRLVHTVYSQGSWEGVEIHWPA